MGLVAVVPPLWRRSRKTRNLRRLRRLIKNASVIRIEDFDDGAINGIMGTVRYRCEPMTAPFSGRACCFYRIRATYYRGVNARHKPLFAENYILDFMLEGEKSRALVRTDYAQVYVDCDKISCTNRMQDVVAERCELPRFFTSLTTREGLLKDGTKLIVFGQGRWETSPTVAGKHYRQPGRRLVLFGTENAPLVITTRLDALSKHATTT